MPDVPFGAGQVGKWQTKSDSMEDGITADLEYFTVNAKWDITDNLNFRGDSLRLAAGPAPSHRLRRHRVPDHDRRHPARAREPDDRAASVGQRVRRPAQLDRRLLLARRGLDAALLSLGDVGVHDPADGGHEPDNRLRRPGRDQPGLYRVRAPDRVAAEPERLLGRQHVVAGQRAADAPGDNAPAGSVSTYPWFFNVSDDALTNAWDEDEAWFGEVTFGLTEKLDLTVGARVSDKTGGDIRYVPIDAFRTPDPAVRPQGDPFAYSQIALDTTVPSRFGRSGHSRRSTPTSSRRRINGRPTSWST